MTTNLGTTRVLSLDGSSAAMGLPTVAALTEYQRVIARTPDLMLWLDPANAPAGGVPLLRDRRAGYKGNIRSADSTTTLGASVLNSLPALVFTGAQAQGLELPNFQIPTDAYTIVAVIRQREAGASTIAGNTTDIAERFNFTISNNGNLRLDHDGATASQAVAASVVAFDGSEIAVVWGSYSQAAGTGAVGKNTINALGTGVFARAHEATKGLFIGRRGAALTSDCGAIDIAEVFLLNRACHLSADTVGQNALAALLAQLTTRYGIV